MQSKDIIVVKSDIEKLREALFNHVKLESDFVRAKTKEFVTFLEKEAKVATERAQLEDKAAPNKTFKKRGRGRQNRISDPSKHQAKP